MNFKDILDSVHSEQPSGSKTEYKSLYLATYIVKTSSARVNLLYYAQTQTLVCKAIQKTDGGKSDGKRSVLEKYGAPVLGG